MVKTLRDPKGRFAGSVGTGKAKVPTVAPTSVLPVNKTGYEDIALTKASNDYLKELEQIKATKKRIKVTEKDTLNLGYSLALAYPKLVGAGIDDSPLFPSNISYEDVKSKLSGLHFAKEMLTPFEREVLTLSESILKKIEPKKYSSIS